jgi:peptidyl-prolyl cis-trans isomerase C
MKREMFYCAAGCAVLALLSGCFHMQKEEQEAAPVKKDGIVLVKIDNKPALHHDEFHKELSSQMRNMDPSMLPKNMQRKFLDDLIRVKLMVEAAKKDRVEDNAEFKEAYQEQQDRLKELLLTRFYSKKLFDTIKIDDKEVKEDYEKNKEKYVKEQGGVTLKGAKFATRDEAVLFFNKVKGKVASFETLAKKEHDSKFKDFGKVTANAQMFSAAPQALIDAALKLKKVPSVDIVKVEKDVWVIAVSEKQAPTHHELADIHDQIKMQLQYGKFKDVYEKHVEGLRKQFTVDVNEDFFKEPAKEKGAEGDTQMLKDIFQGAGKEKKDDATRQM